MSALLVRMRRVLGDEAANATLARNVLPAVACKLPSNSGADAPEPDLHRRCVVFDCAPSRVRVDEVCAADIEAGRRALRVLRRGGGRVPHRGRRRGRAAWARAEVLPRRAASPPGRQDPLLHRTYRPQDHAGIADSSGAMHAAAAAGGVAVAVVRVPVPQEEDYGSTLLPATRLFTPSSEPPLYGPTRGADGSLWMHGDIATADDSFMDIGASIRVRRTDPPPKHKRRPGIPDTAIWCFGMA
ncbi:unnamed protein product [Urochloa decumbens]|uniref:Uncharacterized protein n=1 Tax=Urochloa decumbens TaxID=240449 RepID=A0ABC9DSU6_9POAL